MKKTSVRALTGLLLLLTVSSVQAKGAKQKETESRRTIRDLAGRTVQLPERVQKVIALAGPSYEKVFLLGGKDKLVGAHFYMLDRPWVKETNPLIGTVPPLRSPAEPNVETLLALNPDCVFFWDYPEPLQNMTNAGIPVAVVQKASGNPRTAEEFIAYQKREIGVFASALGGTAPAKAEKWYAYLDEKTAFVKARTASIPEEQRKTAIYAYGEEGLGLFSEYSYVSYWLALAGGKNLADETRAEMDTVVNLEQIIKWNPEVIFMGRMDSPKAVLDNPAWAGIKAVTNKEVYLCPDGVMYWDYSSEGVLLLLFLAQKMYPQLFADLDMAQETQKYYQEFYGYNLSGENAVRLLNHQGPAGK
ncbi:MAG: ABC transporter substrate-binding protein [Spirochaetaceae bacterium]|jgi:iron complex transport system substrate-binding protein|nr:ABC transporter substrate-binding protein [Spirochaetaceae bacterium]